MTAWFRLKKSVLQEGVWTCSARNHLWWQVDLGCWWLPARRARRTTRKRKICSTMSELVQWFVELSGWQRTRQEADENGTYIRSQWPWPLTLDCQNSIISSLSPSGHLCQMWRKSLKVFLRYLVHKNGMDGCMYVQTTQKHNASGHGWCCQRHKQYNLPLNKVIDLDYMCITCNRVS